MDDLKEIIQSLQGIKTYLTSQAIKESDTVTREALVKSQQVVDDVIRLLKLKEREPKPVKVTKNVYNRKFYHCPKCDREFYDPFKTPNYCDKCGQALEWEWKWDD